MWKARTYALVHRIVPLATLGLSFVSCLSARLHRRILSMILAPLFLLTSLASCDTGSLGQSDYAPASVRRMFQNYDGTWTMQKQTKFSYDDLKRLALVEETDYVAGKESEKQTLSYSYDDQGRVSRIVKERSRKGEPIESTTVVYQYDSSGSLKYLREQSNPLGDKSDSQLKEEVISLKWDSKGRLAALIRFIDAAEADDGASEAVVEESYTYDESSGRLTKVVQAGDKALLEYDLKGRIESYRLYQAEGKTTVLRHEYGKDGFVSATCWVEDPQTPCNQALGYREFVMDNPESPKIMIVSEIESDGSSRYKSEIDFTSSGSSYTFERDWHPYMGFMVEYYARGEVDRATQAGWCPDFEQSSAPVRK